MHFMILFYYPEQNQHMDNRQRIGNPPIVTHSYSFILIGSESVMFKDEEK